MNSRDDSNSWWNDSNSFSNESSPSESPGNEWFNSSPSPSFSSNSSSQRTLTFSTVSSGSISSQSFFSRFDQQQPIQLINCELENIFAELLFYTKKITYSFGNVCPTTSPVKQINPSERALGLPTLTISARDIEISRENSAIERYTHYTNGRNYSQLHTQLKKLYNYLNRTSKDGFKLFLENQDVTGLNKEQLKAVKKLPIAHLVVFLKLGNKFPLVSKAGLIKSLQIAREQNEDIYKVYPQLKQKLLKTTLTSKALSTYAPDFDLYHPMDIDDQDEHTPSPSLPKF